MRTLQRSPDVHTPYVHKPYVHKPYVQKPYVHSGLTRLKTWKDDPQDEERRSYLERGSSKPGKTIPHNLERRSLKTWKSFAKHINPLRWNGRPANSKRKPWCFERKPYAPGTGKGTSPRNRRHLAGKRCRRTRVLTRRMQYRSQSMASMNA